MLDNNWFARYCQLVAANVTDKDNKVRFTYVQLRSSLDAVEKGVEEQVDPAVVELFQKIYNTVGALEALTTKQETVLILSLLNIQMAYSLLTRHLIKEDVSIDKQPDELF